MSCSKGGHAPLVLNNYCDIAKPIYLAVEEIPAMTMETKRQILVHNKTWASLCTTPDKVK
ncbi:hypothetical protein PM1_022 [Pectobacterium phage PM1]|uniref:Uncharacterized protein n=1 Tax=Pectobacterium phage PM1 TaxID=1399915 RepID=X2CSU0_9CAUD|nr:Rz-like spanin [Pectobacterium phage PM1]AGV99238.1 hypothetical protein PM1_022 [Pectobacterium phage PM1]